jgi:N-acetylglucosamine kinase-like BadF-type ATPase
MTELLAGLDVGGTKTAVRIETLNGELLLDQVIPSAGWDAEPIAAGAAWIASVLARVAPAGDSFTAVGIGAQGLDSSSLAGEFEAALGVLGYRARAVNDAALLVPAAGLARGIGVISGTGAVGVGTDGGGGFLVTGGWGWVIGDEGGAAGLVREATRAALLAHDDGLPDDGLLSGLLHGFGVVDPERLARAVNDEPTMENWGPRAGAVFAAAEAGSPLAGRIVDEAAAHLARLVTQLRRRGAVGPDVVVAGGMIVAQPRLFEAFRKVTYASHPDLIVHLLRVPPVVGAIALARTLLTPEWPG